jgi:hypothetical protein
MLFGGPVDVGVRVGVAVGVSAGAGVTVDAGVGVCVDIGVAVGVGVEVGVTVGVCVGVSVGVPVGVVVGVGVTVGVPVGVFVGVGVSVGVFVGVGVRVGVPVGVNVGVTVGVFVGVGVSVGVAVGVIVGVLVGVGVGANWRLKVPEPAAKNVLRKLPFTLSVGVTELKLSARPRTSAPVKSKKSDVNTTVWPALVAPCRLAFVLSGAPWTIPVYVIVSRFVRVPFPSAAGVSRVMAIVLRVTSKGWKRFGPTITDVDVVDDIVR